MHREAALVLVLFVVKISHLASGQQGVCESLLQSQRADGGSLRPFLHRQLQQALPGVPLPENIFRCLLDQLGQWPAPELSMAVDHLIHLAEAQRFPIFGSGGPSQAQVVLLLWLPPVVLPRQAQRSRSAARLLLSRILPTSVVRNYEALLQEARRSPVVRVVAQILTEHAFNCHRPTPSEEELSNLPVPVLRNVLPILSYLASLRSCPPLGNLWGPPRGVLAASWSGGIPPHIVLDRGNQVQVLLDQGYPKLLSLQQNDAADYAHARTLEKLRAYNDMLRFIQESMNNSTLSSLSIQLLLKIGIDLAGSCQRPKSSVLLLRNILSQLVHHQVASKEDHRILSQLLSVFQHRQQCTRVGIRDLVNAHDYLVPQLLEDFRKSVLFESPSVRAYLVTELSVYAKMAYQLPPNRRAALLGVATALLTISWPPGKVLDLLIDSASLLQVGHVSLQLAHKMIPALMLIHTRPYYEWLSPEHKNYLYMTLLRLIEQLDRMDETMLMAIENIMGSPCDKLNLVSVLFRMLRAPTISSKVFSYIECLILYLLKVQPGLTINIQTVILPTMTTGPCHPSKNITTEGTTEVTTTTTQIMTSTPENETPETTPKQTTTSATTLETTTIPWTTLSAITSPETTSSFTETVTATPITETTPNRMSSQTSSTTPTESMTKISTTPSEEIPSTLYTETPTATPSIETTPSSGTSTQTASISTEFSTTTPSKTSSVTPPIEVTSTETPRMSTSTLTPAIPSKENTPETSQTTTEAPTVTFSTTMSKTTSTSTVSPTATLSVVTSPETTRSVETSTGTLSTATPSQTSTETPTATPSVATPSQTSTSTVTSSVTPSSEGPTKASTPTATPSAATPSETSSVTETPTGTPLVVTPSQTITSTATPSAETTPGKTSTSTGTPTATPSVETTPGRTPTSTGMPTATPSKETTTPGKTSTSTGMPTETPSVETTPVKASKSTGTPTATPSVETPGNTSRSTGTPTETPSVETTPGKTSTSTGTPTTTPFEETTPGKTSTSTRTATTPSVGTTPGKTSTSAGTPTGTPSVETTSGKTSVSTGTPTATPSVETTSGKTSASTGTTATSSVVTTPGKTSTSTGTPTATPSVETTPGKTSTSTQTPTATPSAAITQEKTSTSTGTPTVETTPGKTSTSTGTPTATPSVETTPGKTSTSTGTPTATPSVETTPGKPSTSTGTPTATPSAETTPGRTSTSTGTTSSVQTPPGKTSTSTGTPTATPSVTVPSQTKYTFTETPTATPSTATTQGKTSSSIATSTGTSSITVPSQTPSMSTRTPTATPSAETPSKGSPFTGTPTESVSTTVSTYQGTTPPNSNNKMSTPPVETTPLVTVITTESITEMGTTEITIPTPSQVTRTFTVPPYSPEGVPIRFNIEKISHHITHVNESDSNILELIQMLFNQTHEENVSRVIDDARNITSHHPELVIAVEEKVILVIVEALTKAQLTGEFEEKTEYLVRELYKILVKGGKFRLEVLQKILTLEITGTLKTNILNIFIKRTINGTMEGVHRVLEILIPYLAVHHVSGISTQEFIHLIVQYVQTTNRTQINKDLRHFIIEILEDLIKSIQVSEHDKQRLKIILETLVRETTTTHTRFAPIRAYLKDTRVPLPLDLLLSIQPNWKGITRESLLTIQRLAEVLNTSNGNPLIVGNAVALLLRLVSTNHIPRTKIGPMLSSLHTVVTRTNLIAPHLRLTVLTDCLTLYGNEAFQYLSPTARVTVLNTILALVHDKVDDYVVSQLLNYRWTYKERSDIFVPLLRDVENFKLPVSSLREVDQILLVMAAVTANNPTLQKELYTIALKLNSNRPEKSKYPRSVRYIIDSLLNKKPLQSASIPRGDITVLSYVHWPMPQLLPKLVNSLPKEVEDHDFKIDHLTTELSRDLYFVALDPAVRGNLVVVAMRLLTTDQMTVTLVEKLLGATHQGVALKPTLSTSNKLSLLRDIPVVITRPTIRSLPRERTNFLANFLHNLIRTMQQLPRPILETLIKFVPNQHAAAYAMQLSSDIAFAILQHDNVPEQVEFSKQLAKILEDKAESSTERYEVIPLLTDFKNKLSGLTSSRPGLVPVVQYIQEILQRLHNEPQKSVNALSDLKTYLQKLPGNVSVDIVHKMLEDYSSWTPADFKALIALLHTALPKAREKQPPLTGSLTIVAMRLLRLHNNTDSTEEALVKFVDLMPVSSSLFPEPLKTVLVSDILFVLATKVYKGSESHVNAETLLRILDEVLHSHMSPATASLESDFIKAVAAFVDNKFVLRLVKRELRIRLADLLQHLDFQHLIIPMEIIVSIDKQLRKEMWTIVRKVHTTTEERSLLQFLQYLKTAHRDEIVRMDNSSMQNLHKVLLPLPPKALHNVITGVEDVLTVNSVIVHKQLAEQLLTIVQTATRSPMFPAKLLPKAKEIMGKLVKDHIQREAFRQRPHLFPAAM